MSGVHHAAYSMMELATLMVQTAITAVPSFQHAPMAISAMVIQKAMIDTNGRGPRSNAMEAS